MNQLIKINQEGLISARELHEFLESGQDFTTWIKNRIEKYEFVEDEDFTLHKFMVGKVWKHDYVLTMDIAKELSMVENNEKGKEARKYFIQVEKAWNSPEMIMKRALEFASKQVENLQLENKQKEQVIHELQPKATYYDLILQNSTLLAITVIAKDYGMSGTALNDTLHELGIQYKQSGTWLLYAKYQDRGYTSSKTQNFNRSDGSQGSKLHTYWTQKGRLFIYDLLKQDGILPLIELEEDKQWTQN